MLDRIVVWYASQHLEMLEWLAVVAVDAFIVFVAFSLWRVATGFITIWRTYRELPPHEREGFVSTLRDMGRRGE